MNAKPVHAQFTEPHRTATLALLLAAGCPRSGLEAAFNELCGVRSPDSIEALMDCIDSAILAVASSTEIIQRTEGP